MESKKVNEPIIFWWLCLFLGIIYFSISVFIYKKESTNAIEYSHILASAAILSGMLSFVFYLRNKKRFIPWRWNLINGIFEIMIGLLFFSIERAGPDSFLLLLYLWIAFRGFSGIAMCYDLRDYGVYCRFMPVLPLAAIICSLGIVVEPDDDLFTPMNITSLSFFILGIYRVVLAFRLRILHLSPDPFSYIGFSSTDKSISF